MAALLPLTADEVASALAFDGADLAAALGGKALTRTLGDADLLITGAPIPQLNGVLTLRTSVSAADVRELLDIVALRNIPHSVQIRPGCTRDLVELVKARGMVQGEPVPLMAMRSASAHLKEMATPPGLTVRMLIPAEAAIHSAIAAEGFGSPPELFEALISPTLLARPGYRAYVGTVDGKDVATSIGFTGGGHVGIFDVATPPAYRGRGYGSAVTARATLDGFEAGASFAYLQSSPMGLKIYERLGFETLERWSVWITPGSPSHS